MPECPKCRGVMTQGVAYVVDSNGARVPMKWVNGRPKKRLWAGLSLKGLTSTDITAARCGKCGFVELSVDPQATAEAEPVPAVAQLKHDMARLLERIAVLERIATDPAERTAREIEALRALPPAEPKEPE